MGSQGPSVANDRVRDVVWQMRISARPAVCTQVCWPNPRQPEADQAAAAADRGGGSEGGGPTEEYGPQQQMGAHVELAWVVLPGRWALQLYHNL